jgi:hypothetical protein
MMMLVVATLRGWGWAGIAGLGGSMLGFAIAAAIAHRDPRRKEDE